MNAGEDLLTEGDARANVLLTEGEARTNVLLTKGGVRVNAWEDLLRVFRAGDESGVLRFLTELDATGRKEIAARLPGYVAEESRKPGWGDWSAQTRPPLLAGVACLGGAAAVASWLFRGEFSARSAWSVESARVVALLRLRPLAWQADVARRIAARMRPTDLRYWEVVAQLVRESGLEPPDADAFKIGWLRTLRPGVDPRDPLFAAYGPRIFEMDGLAGIRLWHVVEQVVALAGDGLLDRATVIDGVVRRLLRDGAGALTELVGLHDRLDLDIDESAVHARNYTALLPAGPVAVADLAVAQLRRLEEAGRLEEDLFAEALVALAFRPEKKLLRAALSWAGDAVLRDAGRADAVLEALPPILAQDTPALQERAVRLAIKLAPKAGPAGREAIRQAAAELAEDQREKLSEAYGGGLAGPDVPAAPALTAGDGPAMPPPIASPEDVAKELAAFPWNNDVYTFERLLAGLAEWSHREPERLRKALRSWGAPLDAYDHGYYGYYGEEIHETIPSALHRAFLAFLSPQASRRLAQGRTKRQCWGIPGAPDRLYHRRALELVPPFESGTGYPVILATPTTGTGLVAPSALLTRLEQLEAQAVPALPADLSQALLRLPRSFSPADVERASRLTSRAGRRCAAWMRSGGLTDPEVSVSVRMRGVFGEIRADLEAKITSPAPNGEAEILPATPGSDPGPAAATPRPDAEFASPAAGLDAEFAWPVAGVDVGFGSPVAGVNAEFAWPVAGVDAEVASPVPDLEAGIIAADPGGLPEEVRALFEPGMGHSYLLTWWPLVLPSHREFAAAHLAGFLSSSMEGGDGQTRALAALVHGDGPPGAALAHALVCGMGHARPTERAAATDAFLTLAARGEVPARELGKAITSLVKADFVKLNRVVSVLDDATQAGAHEAVWEVIAEVLPDLLPQEGERPRTGAADLVAAGARAARIAGARAKLAEVAAVAARKGSSRLVLEARRLAHLIGAPDR